MVKALFFFVALVLGLVIRAWGMLGTNLVFPLRWYGLKTAFLELTHTK